MLDISTECVGKFAESGGFLMDKKLQAKLDREDEIPDDVPHWIVESHHEYDDRDMTPLAAATRAAREIWKGHCWVVRHVRSGLTWSVNLERQETVEVVEVRLPPKSP